MMPPVLNSLGPFTDWLSGMVFGSLASKYDELSKASSFSKVIILVWCQLLTMCAKAMRLDGNRPEPYTYTVFRR